VLYYFQGGSDGANPGTGKLIDVNGMLYGSTATGGGTGCGGGGCGTVYRVNPTTGSESVLHSFQGGSDGENPAGVLLFLNGTLYGTTATGGGSGCGGGGCGTIYSINATTGAESLLYSFQGGSDGANPDAGVTNIEGKLYGTTAYGGTCTWESSGCGTVFSLSL
jgi:uncharacterized repeat protein (TIGR03803 family)